MAFENIQIRSTRNGSGLTVGPRQDLAANDAILLSLTSNAGVSTVSWFVKGRPEGSVAGGAGPEPCLLGSGFTAAFAVDADDGSFLKDGTYVIEAVINPGSPSEARKTTILARLTGLTTPGPSGGSLPIRLPGGFEDLEDTLEAGVAQGWKTMLLRAIRRSLAAGGAIASTLRAAYIAGASASDQTIPLTDADGGGVTIDGSASSGFTGTSAFTLLARALSPFTYLRATGFIGHGTATPGQPYHQRSSAPGIRLDHVGGNALDLTSATDNLDVSVGGTLKARILGTLGGISTAFGIGVGADPETGDAVVSFTSAPAAAVAPMNRLKVRNNGGVFEFSANTGPWTPFATGAGQIIEVANASTLTARVVTGYSQGAIAHVVSFDRLFEYKPASTETVRIGEVIAAAGGVGRWVTMNNPSFQWRALAASYNSTTGAGGIFWDPVGGNDENTGVDAAHGLASFDEICRRLSGTELLEGAPIIRMVSDFGSAENLPVQFPNVEQFTILGTASAPLTSVVLTDATAFVVGTDFGSLVSTGFDWSSFVRSSSIVWARRANIAGGFTYAPLQRAGSLGTVFTGPAVVATFAAGEAINVAFSTPSQPFANGDTVDLVTFPKLTTVLFQGSAAMNLRCLELSQGYPQTTTSVTLGIVSAAVPQTVFNTCVRYDAAGCLFVAETRVGNFGSIGRTANASFTRCGLGSSAVAGQINASVFGVATISNCSFEKINLGITGKASLDATIFHNATTPITVSQDGFLTVINTINGIGCTNVAAVSPNVTGGRLLGAKFFSNNLGATAGTGWTLDGVTVNPTTGAAFESKITGAAIFQ